MRAISGRALGASSLLCILWVFACHRGANSETGSGLSAITLVRDSGDAALSADGNVLAAEMRAGALSLFRAAGGGAVFSPMALQLALGMVYLAAEGQTAAELAAAMAWTLDPSDFAPAQKNLLDIIGRSLSASPAGTTTVLETATRAFFDRRLTLLPPFAAALASVYGAPAAALDFLGNAEGSRQDINAWVGEQTEGKIGELLPSGSVTSNTALVLAAALRFRARWPTPLATSPEPITFTTASGAILTPPALSTTDRMPYRDTAEETSVRMAYADGTFSMLLVRPHGDLAAYLAALTPADLEALVTGEGATTVPVALTLPPFDVAQGPLSFSDALESLGARRIFVPHGELAMVGPPASELLCLSVVFESAHLSLDADGTEAEAAAAAVVGISGATPLGPSLEPVPLVMDKPFLFFLQDTATASIFFMGQVATP